MSDNSRTAFVSFMGSASSLLMALSAVRGHFTASGAFAIATALWWKR